MEHEDIEMMNEELTVVCMNPDCSYIGDMPFDGVCPDCGDMLG